MFWFKLLFLIHLFLLHYKFRNIFLLYLVYLFFELFSELIKNHSFLRSWIISSPLSGFTYDLPLSSLPPLSSNVLYGSLTAVMMQKFMMIFGFYPLLWVLVTAVSQLLHWCFVSAALRAALRFLRQMSVIKVAPLQRCAWHFMTSYKKKERAQSKTAEPFL